MPFLIPNNKEINASIAYNLSNLYLLLTCSTFYNLSNLYLLLSCSTFIYVTYEDIPHIPFSFLEVATVFRIIIEFSHSFFEQSSDRALLKKGYCKLVLSLHKRLKENNTPPEKYISSSRNVHFLQETLFSDAINHRHFFSPCRVCRITPEQSHILTCITTLLQHLIRLILYLELSFSRTHIKVVSNQAKDKPDSCHSLLKTKHNKTTHQSSFFKRNSQLYSYHLSKYQLQKTRRKKNHLLLLHHKYTMLQPSIADKLGN